MTTELQWLLVAWAGWMVIGLALGAIVEGRAPWTGGLPTSSALLVLELAVARAASLIGVPPRADGPLRLVLGWVAVEVAAYAAHRAMHGTRLLWRFHRVHHRPATLRWHHAWRRHPVDDLVFALASAVALGLVGASPLEVGVVVIARRAWTLVLHADIAWPRSPIDRWLATPWFHHRHHDERVGATNFASTLALLDRMFGTASRSG